MGNKFIQLGEGEKVISVIHRNWFHIAKQYFAVFLMAAVFFGALISVPILFPAAFGSEVLTVIAFLKNLFLLGLWIYGFIIWIDYYFDIWIMTDKRVINIEQKGLFMRSISELNYAKIQDVTAEVHGFLETVINYGDVQVQTAGEQERFIFRTVSDPNHIKDVIMTQMSSKEHAGIDELGSLLEQKINR
jgi:uncharacterized membrane protein YdbT with pleckstrin-like domain